MTPSILLLLLSAPLLGLWFLALIVLTFATIYAADPPWKRPEARQKERDEGSVHVVEANHAVAFGLVASCGLLAVWWFPNILVYVSLILFGIGSFYGMQQCLVAIVRSVPSWRIPGSGGVTETIVAAVTVLWWAAVRNTAQAWIWQDILGAFTVTLILRTLKLPSLRVSCLLLTSAFTYDIFWVFVSSRFTSNGESVMEAAATGSGVTVKEIVPMMFRVPVYWAENGDAYTMLGYGDLVLPGLLVTLCKEIDGWIGIAPEVRAYASSFTSIFDYLSSLCVSFRWTYHRAAITGYGAGLQVTFIAMLLTEIGQPALLWLGTRAKSEFIFISRNLRLRRRYLVPCTVFPVIFLGWQRGQLEMMWTGDFKTDGKEADEDGGMADEDGGMANENGPEEAIEVKTA